MLKYRYTICLHMSGVALATILLAGCMLQPASRPQHDIALRIKAVAVQHNAAVQRIAGQTIYEIDVYRVPRGYRTTLTLIEGVRRDAVTAKIYENDRENYRLTVLVDEPLDGRLDYWMTASAGTPNAAWEAIRERRGQVSREMKDVQPLYDQLVRDLRDEVPLQASMR